MGFSLINIGFGNMAAAARVMAIISPESAPVKRMIQDCHNMPSSSSQQRIGLVGLFSADEGILVYHLILCLGNFPSAKDRQQDSTKMPVWYCISYGFLVCYPYSEIQCIL